MRFLDEEEQFEVGMPKFLQDGAPSSLAKLVYNYNNNTYIFFLLCLDGVINQQASAWGHHPV